MDSIKQILIDDDFIKQNNLQFQAQEFPIWFDNGNHASYTSNDIIYSFNTTNEDLPENFIHNDIIEETAEHVPREELSSELVRNHIANRSPAIIEFLQQCANESNNKPKIPKIKPVMKPFDMKDTYTEEELKKFQIPQIKQILKTWKLKVSGKKQFLINRILNHITIRDNSPQPEEEPIESHSQNNIQKPTKIKINDNPHNKSLLICFVIFVKYTWNIFLNINAFIFS